MSRDPLTIYPKAPIDTIDLFIPLSQELIGLLKSLSRAEWQRPTACAGWTVKDVAAHLLGGSLGRVQDYRDPPLASTPSYTELVQIINQNNAAWVQAARRITPSLLIEFLEIADQRMVAYFKTLNPAAPARIAVAWAGEQQSTNWFDMAREYTEKWLHQQHIREALDKPQLVSRAYLFPVLDTFMRALPNTYQGATAPEGSCLSILIEGQAGGEWTLLKKSDQWQLISGSSASTASARVVLSQDTAWRLFTRGLSQAAARSLVVIKGDQDLGERFLSATAIMA